MTISPTRLTDSICIPDRVFFSGLLKLLGKELEFLSPLGLRELRDRGSLYFLWLERGGFGKLIESGVGIHKIVE